MIQTKQIAGLVPVTVNPNAVAFGSPVGAIISDPKLVAAPIDQFGRPQIWDDRAAAGLGAVYRQGSWEADGDPTDQTGEGIVLYGPNALGNGPNAAVGGYARIKPRRMGLAQIITGVNGNNLFYYFRVDSDSLNGMAMTDDTDTTQFFVDRMTGTLQLGNPDSTNGLKGQLFLNQTGPLGGSTAPVQLSELTKSIAIRLAQYGNGLPAPTANLSFFRSRGTTIGALASCVDGDSLMNFTCSGVTADNASVPLAGVFDCFIPLGGVIPVLPGPNGGRSISPNFRWQLAYKTINSRRLVWYMEGLTGNFVMAPRAPVLNLVGQPEEGLILVRDAQASTAAPSAATATGAMQGLVTLGVGGTFVLANTLITANTRIQLNWQDGGANPGPPLGQLFPTGRTPGTGFTISSSNPADAGINVFWQIWQPAP